MNDQLPPHSADAEESVIGALLIDSSAVVEVAEFLKSSDFYKPANAKVFSAVMQLHQTGQPVDILTVSEELERRGQIEEVGGRAALADLCARTPTAVHAKQYARIVERKAVLRNLIAAAGKIAGIGYEETADVSEAVDRAEQVIYDLGKEKMSETLIKLNSLTGQVTDILTARYENKADITGVPTGYYELDRLLAGLQPVLHDRQALVAGDDHGAGAIVHAELVEDVLGVLFHGADRALEDRRDVEGSEDGDETHEPEGEADIANAIGDERLLACEAGFALGVPEADEQVRREADELPRREDDEQVVRENQQEHREHEEVEIGEEAPIAGVVTHVANAVEMDKRTHRRDDDQERPGERVHVEAEIEGEVAGGDPGEERERRPSGPELAEEGGDREAHRRGPRGDDRAERHDVSEPAEAASDRRGKGEADKRKEEQERCVAGEHPDDRLRGLACGSRPSKRCAKSNKPVALTRTTPMAPLPLAVATATMGS